MENKPSRTRLHVRFKDFSLFGENLSEKLLFTIVYILAGIVGCTTIIVIIWLFFT